MITDEDLVREGAALDDRFGAERAGAFGRALPGIVADLTARWGLRHGSPYESGATSVVLAVETSRGVPAVLKVSPDAAFLSRQVGMLRHLAPTGRAPAVLEEDAAAGAVLLERILPGDTLDSTRTAPPTPQEWAALLRDLHGTSPSGVRDVLADRCEEMFERIGERRSRPQVRPHVPDALWQRAVQECRQLLRDDREDAVIHGDLHLGNVLHGAERGLVVIDPKLCVGDRCFDMVDFVVVDGAPSQMVARARELASLVDLDPDRLLAWSRVNAVVTAVSRITWHGPGPRTDALLALAESA